MTTLEGLSTLELLQLHSRILARLKVTGVTRTSNASGDYAERLFAEAFGWKLKDNSHSGFDALDGEIRIQIKCRRLTVANPSRQLGEFSKFELRKFDHLAAVLFAEDFTIQRAAVMPWEAVDRLSHDVQGRRRFYLREAVWAEPDVKDVSVELREAQARL